MPFLVSSTSTLLKATTQNSSDLQPNQMHKLGSCTVLELTAHQPAAGHHWQVTLKSPLGTVGSTGYIYREHGFVFATDPHYFQFAIRLH